MSHELNHVAIPHPGLGLWGNLKAKSTKFQWSVSETYHRNYVNSAILFSFWTHQICNKYLTYPKGLQLSDWC